MRHEAIFALYPKAISVVDGVGVFDKDENLIEIDEAAVQIKAAELQSVADAKLQAAEATKQSALNKLAAIGLTPDEIKQLLGV